MHLKTSYAKRRPFGPGGDELFLSRDNICNIEIRSKSYNRIPQKKNIYRIDFSWIIMLQFYTVHETKTPVLLKF